MKKLVQEILAPSDVIINGTRPWDIQVHNPDFYSKVLSGGSLALGESYMSGWWDCQSLDQFFEKIMGKRLDKKVNLTSTAMLLGTLKAKLVNVQKRSKAYIVGKRHYDLGNQLFSLMLDKGMNYSCAFWDKAKDLDHAQEDKLELICQKMDLKPGLKVLDIGCGWGAFAKYAAQKHHVKVHGITVSRKQAEFVQKRCQGLDVSIELQDYHKLEQKFDRIVSIGMFEHVGYKNYRTFMKVVNKCLQPDGLFLLHTIAGNSSQKTTDPWINKYIFPNSMLPSAKQISASSEGLFVLEDLHSFGEYYDRTLMAWHDNFIRNWTHLKKLYDERFYRMWNYYILACAGSFRARRLQLWQIVYSKEGLRENCQKLRKISV